MKIVVDGMGGDNAPVEILKGCALAVREYGVEIIITGDEAQIKKAAEENSVDMTGITVEAADGIITMEDNPLSLRTEKKNSSLGKAFQILKKGEADALVGAGNSGALLVGATIIAGRIKGVNRPAFAAVFPGADGYTMLLDSGANVECTPHQLEQFALLGSVYMEKMFGIASPRIGLANNGTEATKGTDLYRQTHALLEKNGHINFVGNVEGRALMAGGADVIVADGFAGNLMLKSAEGAAKFMTKELKNLFSGFAGKIAGALVLKKIKSMKKRLDVKEIGGAPILGSAKCVVKAHGNSDAKAFSSAVRQARDYASSGIIEKVSAAMAEMQADKKAEENADA